MQSQPQSTLLDDRLRSCHINTPPPMPLSNLKSLLRWRYKAHRSCSEASVLRISTAAIECSVPQDDLFTDSRKTPWTNSAILKTWVAWTLHYNLTTIRKTAYLLILLRHSRGRLKNIGDYFCPKPLGISLPFTSNPLQPTHRQISKAIRLSCLSLKNINIFWSILFYI